MLAYFFVRGRIVDFIMLGAPSMFSLLPFAVEDTTASSEAVSGHSAASVSF